MPLSAKGFPHIPGNPLSFFSAICISLARGTTEKNTRCAFLTPSAYLQSQYKNTHGQRVGKSSQRCLRPSFSVVSHLL